MHKNTLATSRVNSYVLGPLDLSRVTWLDVDPLDAPAFKLPVLVSPDLPALLLRRSRFRDGAIVGYEVTDLGEEIGGAGPLPVRVANWLWRAFSWDLLHGSSYAWTVGYLLGALAFLAETDRELALVGLAHLSFLLSLVPNVPHPLLSLALHRAGASHNLAVRDYRAKVRTLREQGMDLLQASRLALAGGQSSYTPNAQRQTLTV